METPPADFRVKTTHTITVTARAYAAGRFKTWHQKERQQIQVHWEYKQALFQFFTDKLNVQRMAKHSRKPHSTLHHPTKRAQD